MELELIDSKRVSNEVIDSFYQYLEQQEKNAEILEELEYNESKTIITRRKFLQYSALGAVGFGLGLSTEKAEAGFNPLFLPLIIPLGIGLWREWLRSKERASGPIVIINNTDRRKRSEMEIELISSRSIKSDVKYAKYNVPAFTENTYRYKNGPSLYTSRDITCQLKASNEHGHTYSDRFTLRA